MICKLSLITALAACVTSVVSVDTEFQLYAYGKVERPGLRLCYADGKAYVGGLPSFAKEALNITRKVAAGIEAAYSSHIKCT